MTRADERLILRWLAGELPEAEARALRARLAEDPALAQRSRELEELWASELGEWATQERELGTDLALGARLAGRVAAPGAPAPRLLASIGAVTTLAAGIAVGVVLGSSLSASPTFDDAGLELRPELAESYAEGLEAEDFGSLATESEP